MKSPVASSSISAAVDGLGVELPVEAFQCLVFGEVRITNPALDDAFTLLHGLAAEEPIQQLQMRPAALLGLAEHVVQLVLGDQHAQRLQVLENSLTRHRRRRRRRRLRRVLRLSLITVVVVAALSWAAPFSALSSPRFSASSFAFCSFAASRASLGLIVQKFLVVLAATGAYRIVAQQRLQLLLLFLGQGVQRRFGSGPDGQNPLDGTPRVGTIAHRALDRRQQIVTVIRLQQGQNLMGFVFAVAAMLDQAFQETDGHRPQLFIALFQHLVFLLAVVTGLMFLLQMSLPDQMPCEQRMPRDLFDLRAIDDQFLVR